MPRAVSGLTKHDAPSAALVPAGSGRQSSTFTVRYCEYIAPPSTATVLPSSAAAAAHRERRQVGGAEQQADVGRIDRRRLDAHDHFVGRRLGRANANERELELAAVLDDRAELESVAGHALVQGFTFSAMAKATTVRDEGFRTGHTAHRCGLFVHACEQTVNSRLCEMFGIEVPIFAFS